MRQINYTEPQLSPRNASAKDMHKVWRVRFDFYQDGKRFTITRKQAGSLNLNDIDSYRDRIRLAKDMASELKRRLAKGWNPITGEYPAKTAKELELEALQDSSFEEALQFAFDKKKSHWRGKTESDFRSAKKYLVAACNNLGIVKAIKDFRKVDFKMILEEVAENRKLSNKGYNKFREYLSSLISELVEWDIMESNVIRDIKTREVQKTFAHRPPTQDQRLAIVQRIKTVHPDYFRFISVIYGCGIRPREITRIRIKHLHKLEHTFRLPAEITKSGIERDIAVPRWVMDLFSELNLHKYNPDWYLFASKPGMFRPGPKPMSANVPHNYWRRIVKEGLGLDINQYSLKKLSADDLVKLQRREGATRMLGLAQLQFGHESERMTSIYTHQDKAEMMEIIKEKMPEL